MFYIQQFANLNGVYQTKDTWWQAICESQGIYEPVNGSWVQALAQSKGANNVSNGTWVQALAEAMGIALNGTWLQSLGEQGSFRGAAFRSRVVADSGTIEAYICLINKLKDIS